MATSLNHGSDSKVFSNIGEKLYLQPENADVYFTFETTGDRVPAHKLLLSSASDVFEAMFHGPLKEIGDIKIVDVSADALKEFLQFFYFNRIALSMENVADVMYLGKKYDVKECLILCLDLLTANITADNVMSALGMAIMYDQKELVDTCEWEIRSHLPAVLQSPDFWDCDRQLLGHILQMTDLECTEMELFEATMAWVRTHSKQDEITRDIVQTHLGDLFYVIRFESMSMTEFYNLYASYEHIFSDEEYNEIVQVISGIDVEPRLFKKCRRFWDDRNVIVCDRNVHGTYSLNYTLQIEEMTTFSTNMPLLLGYFTCVPLYRGTDAVSSIKLHATITANFKEIQTQFSFEYAHNKKIFLPTPVKIRPQFKYEIRISFPYTKYAAYNTFKQPHLKTIANIGHRIKVNFVDSNLYGASAGSILELGFNCIE